jgi:hypothetical protein
LSATGGSSAIITARAQNSITIVSGSGNPQGAITLSASTNPTFGLGGVIISQSAGVPTQLKTGIATTYSNQPVNYYPAVHIDNANAATVAIEAPKIPYQTLILMNAGITPLTTWVDFGASLSPATGVDCMYLTNSQNELWVALSGSPVSVVILDPTTLLPVMGSSTITLSGVSSGSGTTKVNCFFEISGYMYIGGDFTTINTDAQGQYGITRVNMSSYNPDVMYDNGGSTNCGVNGYVNTIAGGWGDLICGGKFNSLAFSNTPVDNAVRITQPNQPSGNQQYDDIAGQLRYNAEVFCSVWDSGTNNLFIGGAFTLAGPSLVATYNRFVAWNTSSNTNTACDGNNITSTIYNCGISNVNGSFVLAYGGSYIGYIEVANPNNTATSAGVSPSTVSRINLMSNRNGKDTFATDNGDVYQTLSFQVWVTLGQSNPGFTESGVIHTATGMIASYSNYANLRENNPASQTVTFSAPGNNFYISTGSFTNAVFNTPYTAQQFISTSNSAGWVPVGNPVCSFN